jgi:hypothetical protein
VGFADAGMVAGQFELHLRVRQQAQPVANFLRDSDLPLARDLHCITPTGKSNPSAASPQAGARSFDVLAGFPLTLALPPAILPKPSWVKISQIRTISADRLGKKIAAVGADTLAQLIDGLLELVG